MIASWVTDRETASSIVPPVAGCNTPLLEPSVHMGVLMLLRLRAGVPDGPGSLQPRALPCAV